MIRVFVGFDPREAVCYHVFCHSVARRTRRVVGFTPLKAEPLPGFEGRRDGSNDFIYSRFLVPTLCDFKGWAIYADGDMVCLADIEELWRLRDDRFAVMVAKHDYKTKQSVKYTGAANRDYPRKNWSSLILWNGSHPANRALTQAQVAAASGAWLHGFKWLDDELIGSIPLEWNWIDTELPYNPEAKLVHYSLGAACFPGYEKTDHAHLWIAELQNLRTAETVAHA